MPVRDGDTFDVPVGAIYPASTAHDENQVIVGGNGGQDRGREPAGGAAA